MPVRLSRRTTAPRSTRGRRRHAIAAAAVAAVVTATLAAVALAPGLSPTATAAPTHIERVKAPADPVGVPADVEDLAKYVPANSCDPHAKPGTTRLGDLLRNTYPTTSYAIDRTCGTDPLPTSEHYDGRAVDWFTSVRSAEGRARAGAVIDWLLNSDKKGNRYANARRLGVMYIIWNDRIWGSYRSTEGWRPYSSCATTMQSSAFDTTCHRDHVHISLSWEGAMARTSFWSGNVADTDYGPCRAEDLNWAGPYRRPRAIPCPPYPRVTANPKAGALRKTLTTYSGMTVRPGDTGPVVRAVQQAVGATADGIFGTGTRSAVRSWRVTHGLRAGGVVNAATWRTLLRPARTLTTTPDPNVHTTGHTTGQPAPRPVH